MSLLRPTTGTRRLNWWEFQDILTPLNSFNCFFHEIKLCFNVTMFLTLLLRQDDLGGEGVLGVGDGMVQQTDTADNLPSLLHIRTELFSKC